MSEYSLFTSESVSEGHPDKIADQISDAVLDAIIARDKNARVACETMVKTGVAIVAGEISTSAWVDLEALVRKVITDIGYTSSDVGFDGATCGVLNLIGKQSLDIAQGVDRTKPEDQGAGDQGLMFGYATNETDSYMPAPIHYAHRLVERQAELRKHGLLPWLRPDAKSQLTFRYDAAGKPCAVDAVVLSTQHDPKIDQEELREMVRREIIEPVISAEWLTATTKYHINPTGNKPSKVDRSAAYAGRYVAKNIVAAGLADKCEIQVSYAIGVAEPTSVSVNTFGTGRIDDNRIGELVREHFDLRPNAITRMLELLHPMYQLTAAYGHFGREPFETSYTWTDTQGQEQTETFTAFPWEKTDKVDLLRKVL